LIKPLNNSRTRPTLVALNAPTLVAELPPRRLTSRAREPGRCLVGVFSLPAKPEQAGGRYLQATSLGLEQKLLEFGFGHGRLLVPAVRLARSDTEVVEFQVAIVQT
jgi:hypothetical protein